MQIIISAKLKQFRKENRLSQGEIAEMLGVSKQCISKWESERCYPDIFLLPKLSQMLKCSIDDFFVEKHP